MAIIEENAPTQQVVQLVNGMLNWIVGSNEISVVHVKNLLQALIKLCEITVDQKTVDEDWLTEITGTGGGLGGLKVHTQAEIVEKVLKIEKIRSGLDRSKFSILQ
ncbi:unnamed protein product [Rotaria magnacalcarata]|uniref:Uncharacterized protein n=1 Tax=Rotaria magnacalcarata TaxID=392030 RepID=A0A816QR16_9BILA|nr:unnamed protein product [Rotaria magnacalcarata]CAF2124349.1 unnamed protein product [Rotaria magnacalcarata]